ncbi:MULTISPECIES: nucleotide exchange factor GrpE [unclassified Frigoribacterium]|uniref:nucleotide exchange factor GrpE n=1 Tax=unclassified Frigoribacterium TaxID=2627005 RepID=UPI000F473E4A|nr:MULTISPECIES: nucleotide exchange factor GrpE [unclassified Frigoribacterium]ROP73561.1 molecular chaperone GrpE [Frigoribacterium sp. PhB107]TDT63041.1 molecular chaperone GrpE [Frigoribacterium sp. PhB116]
MADENGNTPDEPVVNDKRRIDPETGEVRPEPAAPSEDGGTAAVTDPDELIEAEAPDVEVPAGAEAPEGAAEAAAEMAAEGEAEGAEPLSADDEAILDAASRDLVADMRQDMLRAQAELVNFRRRVERDREANREAVVAEVVRSLLPALDDLARAEKHGDLAEGPMVIVAQKIRGGLDKFGLVQVGEKGEVFDPTMHDALVQLPSADVTVNTVADVIEPGYKIGDRVIRAAKVAVHTPQ